MSDLQSASAPVPASITDVGSTTSAWKSPNWKIWKEKGECRMSNAFALLYGVRPTKSDKAAFRAAEPGRYREMKQYRNIAIGQFGRELPRIEDHPIEVAYLKDEFVRLVDFLAFAKRRNWPGVAAMAANLDIDFASLKTSAGSPQGESESRDDPGKEAHGVAYQNLLRTLGALVQHVAGFAGQPIPRAYLNAKGEINATALGFALEKIAMDSNGSTAPLSGLKQRNIRKLLGQAGKALGSKARKIDLGTDESS